MLVLRPVTIDDLDNLYELAIRSKYGLTTLPKDKKVLKERLEYASQTFELKNAKPRGELYFFVLEDTELQKLIGTTAIISKVGGFEPFYAYKIKYKTFSSSKLNITRRHRILSLIEDHDGPTEIASLFLHPGYRKKYYGKLLSLTRFLYMAEHRSSFEPIIIAEMRGVVDEEKQSPFWNALGKYFFNMDYEMGDYLSIVDKSFIADLLPKDPIYIKMLPNEAQKVVNKVHPNTEPALAILKKEGFKLTGMVDIFDAGPIVSCHLKNINSVEKMRRSKVVSITEHQNNQHNQDNYIIMNTNRQCRASIGYVREKENGIELNDKLAELLNITIGDYVCCLQL